MFMQPLGTSPSPNIGTDGGRAVSGSPKSHSSGRAAASAIALNLSDLAGARALPEDNAASDRRILIVSHDQEAASGVAQAMTQLGHIVEFASDGAVALAKVLTHWPDLIFCDVSRPSSRGLEFLSRLSQADRFGPLAFVPHTDRDDRESELASRWTGALDCPSKRSDFELLRAEVVNTLLRLEGKKPTRVNVQLTRREKDVLSWVSLGKTSAEIAIILGVRERTVNFHCDQAMRRLDVVNRTHAVAKALSQGLIEVSELTCQR